MSYSDPEYRKRLAVLDEVADTLLIVARYLDTDYTEHDLAVYARKYQHAYRNLIRLPLDQNQ